MYSSRVDSTNAKKNKKIHDKKKTFRILGEAVFTVKTTK